MSGKHNFTEDLRIMDETDFSVNFTNLTQFPDPSNSLNSISSENIPALDTKYALSGNTLDLTYNYHQKTTGNNILLKMAENIQNTPLEIYLVCTIFICCVASIFIVLFLFLATLYDKVICKNVRNNRKNNKRNSSASTYAPYENLPWGSIYVSKSSYAENYFEQGNRKNEYTSVVNHVGNL